MGKPLLVWRLGMRDIRRRPAQAALLLLAIAAGATALTLGLSLRGATVNPYAATRVATNGPDVVAASMPSGPHFDEPANAEDLVRLAPDERVASSSGPFPVTWTLLRRGQSTAGSAVEGRNPESAAIDQPKLIHGGWVRPGGVVLDAGFADSLGLHVGDRLSLGADNFNVVGTAVTAAIPNYPHLCAFTCLLTMGLRPRARLVN